MSWNLTYEVDRPLYSSADYDSPKNELISLLEHLHKSAIVDYPQNVKLADLPRRRPKRCLVCYASLDARGFCTKNKDHKQSESFRIPESEHGHKITDGKSGSVESHQASVDWSIASFDDKNADKEPEPQQSDNVFHSNIPHELSNDDNEANAMHQEHPVWEMPHSNQIISQDKKSVQTPWDQDWDEWMATRPNYNQPGHQLGYDPQKHAQGKGFVLNDGSVWTWPTQDLRPMHMDYSMKAKRLGIPVIPGSAFHIQNGQLFNYGEGRILDPKAITGADPRLEMPGDEWSFDSKTADVSLNMQSPEPPEVIYGQDQRIPDYGGMDFSWRQPTVYDAHAHQLFIGQPGTHHEQLYDEFGLRAGNRRPILGYWASGEIPNDATNWLKRGEMNFDMHGHRKFGWEKALRDKLNVMHSIPSDDWSFQSSYLDQTDPTYEHIPGNPNVVKVRGGMNDPEYGWRTPVIWDPKINTVRIGDPGAYHFNLMRNMARLSEGYTEGWISHPNVLRDEYHSDSEAPERDVHGLQMKNTTPEHLEHIRQALVPYEPYAAYDVPREESEQWAFTGGMAQDNGYYKVDPNDHGKFIIDKNWQPHVWRTGDEPDGDPTHYDYLKTIGLPIDELQGLGWIHPGGRVMPATFEQFEEHADRAREIVQNELGFGPPKQDWEFESRTASAYSDERRKVPEDWKLAFDEFAIQTNKDDRDSGELDDISQTEAKRLYKEWQKLPGSKMEKYKRESDYQYQ